jgi:shikimate 5-dehydrogenase
MTRSFVFIGVTTGESSMVRIFPRWRDVLGLGPDVELVGRDLPIHAPAEQYRETARWMEDDPSIVGGLVTTHKIDLYRAARDIFDWVDADAALLGEVSCVARREGRLLGWAKDPVSAGRALDTLLGPGYFARTGGEVLCFGAGGAGNAITLHLLRGLQPGDRPARIVVTDPDESRLRHLRALHDEISGGVPIEYVDAGDPARGDELLSRLQPYSLVVNATGMGKDRPGSPLTDAARFPEHSIAWELNYRGELRFLHQAWEQRESRDVRVEDGWRYFILGWASVIEEVFQRPISDRDIGRLADEAAFARPPLPTTALRG